MPPAGVFHLGVPVEALFFVGNQLIATSHTGRIGVWNAVTKHWQVSLGQPGSLFPSVCDYVGPGFLPISLYLEKEEKNPTVGVG